MSSVIVSLPDCRSKYKNLASKSRNGIATAPVVDLFLSNLLKIYSIKTKKTTHLVIRIPNAFILNNIFFFSALFYLDVYSVMKKLSKVSETVCPENM